MHHPFRRFVAVGLLLGFGLHSTAAFADNKEDANKHFKRGIELFKEEDYASALSEFKKARELSGSFKPLFNIAQVCFQMKNYVCALDTFEEYLKAGGAEITPDRVEEVKKDIEKLQQRVGSVTLTSNTDGASVSIDGEQVGKTPFTAPVRVSMGDRTITATKVGKAPFTQKITVGSKENKEVKIELVDSVITKTERVVVEKEKLVGVQAPPSKWTTLSTIGIAAAGVMAVGWGITGIYALTSSNDLSKKQYTGEPPSDVLSLQSRVKALRITSDLLLAGTIVTAATTLTLTFVLGGKNEDASPKPLSPAAKSTARSRFQWGVNVSPTSAGIVGQF